jgi:hypothetical protein
LAAALALALPRPATAQLQTRYGTAVVDGHFYEWSPLFGLYPPSGLAFLLEFDWHPFPGSAGWMFPRYSCSTQTLYVLVMSVYPIKYGPGYPVTGGVDGVDRYSDTSGNDGIPPDFAAGVFPDDFPGVPGGYTGYEASFQLPPGGSHTMQVSFWIHIDDVYGTRPVSAERVEFRINCATAVSVGGFAATRAASGVTLSWTTGSEVGIAGFNVWRSTRADDGLTKLNSTLIVAKNPSGLAGATYSFNDGSPGADGPYFYRLEVIGTDGRSRMIERSP